MAQEHQPTQRKPLSTAEVIHLIDMATQGFRHAEIIVQSRLNNFLLAASILCLSWATMYAGGIRQHLILALLPSLGAILSIFWYFLGSRQPKFLQLHMNIVSTLERKLEKEFRVTQPIKDLQDGKAVKALDVIFKLNKLELATRSRNLLCWVPGVFLSVFMFLFFVSIFGS